MDFKRVDSFGVDVKELAEWIYSAKIEGHLKPSQCQFKIEGNPSTLWGQATPSQREAAMGIVQEEANIAGWDTQWVGCRKELNIAPKGTLDLML